MDTQHVSVRYMVDDVQQAVDWYTKHLGFSSAFQRRARFCRRRARRASAVAERREEFRGPPHARRCAARARRLESL